MKDKAKEVTDNVNKTMSKPVPKPAEPKKEEPKAEKMDVETTDSKPAEGSTSNPGGPSEEAKPEKM